MKDYLFRIWDLGSDETSIYTVQACNDNEAKLKFMKACIPLCYNLFDYDTMVTMFCNENIEIIMIPLEEIIKL